jgi:hypothetical protein
MVLNQTFPNCWNALRATMTQITIICFDNISGFFIVLFVLSFVKIWGERTNASIRAFTDEWHCGAMQTESTYGWSTADKGKRFC